MTLADDKKRWEAEILSPALERSPERKAEFEISSNIPLPRLLVPGDPDPDYAEKLGFPGEYPYTRGVQPTMYRGRFWTMRQYAGYASAQESNRRYRYLLEHGQTGLSVAFDLPTQIGYDADDPMALGEVGKVGVSISSLDDMAALLQEIPLGEVSTSMTINAPAAILLAMYIAVARRQGVRGAPAARDDSKRHPQRVHCPRHLHLSPCSFDAPDHRRIQLLPAGGAALEYDLDLWLPYS